jgi:hypothetical protein
MSPKLKMMLNKVAAEDNYRKKTELEEGIDRYKSLLFKLVKDKRLDIILSFEGTEQPDMRNKRIEAVHFCR